MSMSNSSFSQTTLNARVSLDAKLSRLRSAAAELALPRGGWMRTIRMALGMSTTELAKRLGTSPSTVSRNETHEAQGVVTLGTLKKAAEAMNCDVVYALVPREKLSDTVMREARRIATKRLTATQNTMALEDQAVDQAVLASLIENEAQILSLSPGLWKTNPPNG